MSGALVVRYSAILTGLLVIGPLVVFCLWPRVLRVWFEAGPEGIDAAASPMARDSIAALRLLGFQPLGVKVEKALLRPRIRELAFVAGDGRCYASVAGSRLRSRFYYYTPLPTGGLVLTSNGTFPKIDSPKVVQRSYPRSGARELLEHHHEALASLGQRGDVVPTAKARVEATYAYYNTAEVRTVLVRTGTFLLVWLVLIGWLLARP